ncbi:hypothetical protein [Thauera phenolivorans]|uniref:hypothetical protein n=1 Tax=Thauera phenolivorans TaxID=1792543 RepID=UPI0013018C5B|nr:hypothetical protein [Thauera phenolivorans]
MSEMRMVAPPPLHAALAWLPAAADAVLVHEVAIAGSARGHGLAARPLPRVAPA